MTADTALYSGIGSPDGPAVPARPPARLPYRYYLGHFAELIGGVRARYDFLLNDHERQHLQAVEALTEPARMLYARLVNRRGPCFRLDRLAYPDIGPLDLPVAELLAVGLLEICDEAFDPTLRARLFACFTHRELKAHLLNHGLPKHARKGELLAWLAAWDQCSTWLAKFLVEHAVVRIPQADPWPFLRFLFFGELRDNLSDFVTNALGYVVTEHIDAHQLIAHFTSRGQAEDAYRMAVLYVEFRALSRDRGDCMKIALTYRSATRLNMTAATRFIPNDILSPFERAAWSGNASTSAGAIAVGQAPLVAIRTRIRGMWR